MIFPIRCYTCNKIIAHLWQEYDTRIKNGEESKKILDEMQLNKYCCRKNFLGHVEIIDRLIKNNSN
jgi:DNA-directed RNA polymerase subunit N